MKKLILAIAIFLGASPLWAELMTYQGRLKESGIPVTGNRLLTFEFCDQEDGSGACFIAPGTPASFAVANGLFKSTITIHPNVDLAVGAWYLRVTVGSSVLTPLERLTAVPYSVFASSAGYAAYAAGAVLKAGDTMTGQLTLDGSTLTITGSDFSVGGSTFVVKQGSVGIGTASPNNPLEVWTNGQYVFTGGAPTSNAVINLIPQVGGTAMINNNADGSVALAVGHVPHLVVDKDGNVGVGSALPSYRLSVSSGAGETGTIMAVSTGTSDLFWVAGDGAHATKFYGDGSGLSGVTGATDNTKVLKTGDTMTGPLYILSDDLANDTSDFITTGLVISTGGAIQTTGLGHGTAVGNARGKGAVDLQSYRSLPAQVASGNYSVLSGGFLNRAVGAYSAVGGGYTNSANTGYATVGGGIGNTASGLQSTVAGGDANAASGQYSAVGGGNDNRATGMYSAVPGGYNNTAEGNYSFAAGGRSSSTAQGAFTWQDSGGAAINLINNVTDRTVFKSRGGFLVTGSTNTSITGTLDRAVFITGNGLVGVSTGAPQAALDVVSTGNTVSDYAQIWRDSSGVDRASVTATGVFYGNGSGLTGVTAAGAVQKAGDTMQGTLDMGGNFLAGVSTITMLNGSIAIVPPGTGGTNHTYGISIGSGAYNNYTYGVGLGNNANDNYFYGVGVGHIAQKNNNYGVGVGYGAHDNYNSGVGIGQAAAYNSDSGVGVGSNASGNDSYAVGIGAFSKDNRPYGAALGAYSYASSSATALGAYAKANAELSLALGYGTVNNSTGTASFGNYAVNAPAYLISGSTVIRHGPGIGTLAVGHAAGGKDTGAYNLFVGSAAGHEHLSGTNNVMLGYGAGNQNTDGAGNTFIGSAAGNTNVTGDQNIVIGFNQQTSDSGGSSELNIGGLLFGQLGFKTIGISTRAPQAALDIVSTGTLSSHMAQIWRDSNGLIVGSMSVTGSMQAVRYVGDGSGLSNVTASGAVQKIGDVMTGPLTINSSTLLQANDFVTTGILISTGGAIQTTGLGHGTAAGNSRGMGAVDLQTYRAVNTEVAGGYMATLSGGYSNTASGYIATVSGGQSNTASNWYSTVSGGYQNTASGNFAAVSGGQSNTASYSFSTVSGGLSNTASNTRATVSGGVGNTASGYASTVSGGSTNTALGELSWAGGHRSSSTADGAFTWSDSRGYEIRNALQDRTLFKNEGGFMVAGSTVAGSPILPPNQAMLDIISTGTTVNQYAQVWRDSDGVAKASVTATGVYYGDGSGLRNITADGAVQKTGDVMDGPLYLDGTGGSNVSLKITRDSAGELITAGLSAGATMVISADSSSVGIFSGDAMDYINIGAGMNTAMTVTQNRVGVNNIAPVYSLDVNGNGRFTDQVIAGGSVTVAGNAFSVGASTFVVSAGRVGINWSTPEAALQVGGGAKFLSSPGTSYILTAGSSARPDMFFVSSSGIVGVGDFTGISVDTYSVASVAQVLKSGADGAVGLSVFARTDKNATVTATGPEQVLAGGNFEAAVGGDDSVTLLAGLRAQLRRESAGAGGGVVSKAYGLIVDDIYTDSGAGVITDTYGIYIGNQSSGFGGMQTNAPYAIYSQDPGARSYLAGNLGLGYSDPVARLELTTLDSDPATMGQIWRNSLGNIVSSMSATGVMKATKFIGDGSGLTNIPGVQKTGDTMTGALTMSGSSITIRNSFGYEGLEIRDPGAAVIPELRLARNDSIYWDIGGAGGGTPLAFQYSGVNRLHLTAEGNLTINDVGQIVSRVKVRPDTADAYSLFISSADGSTPALTVRPGGELYTAGRVGIGLIAPTEALDISGRVQISTRAGGNDVTDGLLSHGAGGIEFYSGGTRYMKVANGGGYIGIGPSANVNSNTMSPKLQVKGSMSVGSTYGTYQPPANSLVLEGRLGVGTPAPDAALSVVQSDVAVSSYTVHIGTSASAYHLVVTTAGWVGLNTRQPQAPLHLTAATKDEGIVVEHNSDTAEGSYLALLKARGTTNSQALVQDGDNLGVLAFGGYNATSGDPFPMAAAIVGRVDGTPTISAPDMPGRLEFMTAADGTNETVTRMVIRSDGGVGIATGTPQAMLDIRSTSTVAQIWRDNAGIVAASMTAAGVLYANVYGLNDKVSKAGDFMFGPLTISVDTDNDGFDLTTTGLAISTSGSLQTQGFGDGTTLPGTRGIGAVDLQTSRNSSAQIASGDYSVIGGGYQGTASGQYSSVAGGYSNTASNAGASVGGGQLNNASGNSATVSGGYSNSASNTNASVGGGTANRATGTASVVPGGEENLAAGQYSWAGGYRSSSTASGAFTWADGEGVAVGNDVSDRVRFKARGGFMVSGSTAATMGASLNRGVMITGDGRVGVGVQFPEAAVDAAASGVGGAYYSQIWRDGNGTIVSSVSATGKFYGDGSGLSSINAVAKTGDSMTGVYALNNATVSLSNAGFYYGLVDASIISTGSYFGSPTVFAWSSAKGSIRAGMDYASRYSAASIGNLTTGFGYGALASGSYSTVTGGYLNEATGNSAVVGGGYYNAARADRSAVTGGEYNVISGSNSFIGGGAYNTVKGTAAVVAGGERNSASGYQSFIGGGSRNTAQGILSSVVGGTYLVANGQRSFLGGGAFNTTDAQYGVIVGGYENKIQTGADAAFVGGGRINTVTATGLYSAVVGGSSNTVSGEGSFIGGGAPDALGNPGNRVYSSFSSIVGGSSNTIDATAHWGFIGGGSNNQVSRETALIAGGSNNRASGLYSAIVGGLTNTAAGDTSAVGGGASNIASGDYAAVPGGYLNTAKGNYSFAAGYRSSSTAAGAFTWSDSQGVATENSVPDQVRFKARGGFVVSGSTNTADPKFMVTGAGDALLDNDRTLAWGVVPAPYITGNDSSDLLAFGLTGGEKMKLQSSQLTLYNASVVLSTNGPNAGITFQDGSVQTSAAPKAVSVYKAATLIKTLDASPAPDPDLQFNIGANEKWAFEFNLYVYTTDPSGVADFRVGLVGPTPVQVRAQYDMYAENGLTVLTGGVMAAYGEQWVNWTGTMPGVGTRVVIKGTVENGAGPGTVAITWSQNTASAVNTNVLKGSSLIANKLN